MTMTDTKKIIVEPTAVKAAAKAAEIFKAIVGQAVADSGACRISLSGGSTPRTTYHELANHAITDGVPWSRVDLFLGDEHDVPQDDIESNYHMIQRILLDNAPIDWERVYPMRADCDDIQAAAAEYEQIIRSHVPAGENGIPQFDLVMLGIGGDGHTASLFPASPGIDEHEKLVVASYVPILGRNRMSITFPVINAAKNILLLVTGGDKATIVRRIFQDNDQSLPAARINPTHGTFHIVLDADAARLL